MIYGHDKTWHRTEYVDVETTETGEVVAVWFRCICIPFRQTTVDRARTKHMRDAYERGVPSLNAVDVTMPGDK